MANTATEHGVCPHTGPFEFILKGLPPPLPSDEIAEVSAAKNIPAGKRHADNRSQPHLLKHLGRVTNINPGPALMAAWSPAREGEYRRDDHEACQDCDARIEPLDVSVDFPGHPPPYAGMSAVCDHDTPWGQRHGIEHLPHRRQDGLPEKREKSGKQSILPLHRPRQGNRTKPLRRWKSTISTGNRILLALSMPFSHRPTSTAVVMPIKNNQPDQRLRDSPIKLLKSYSPAISA